MRIVSRAELRKMPPGTPYADYHASNSQPFPEGPTMLFLQDWADSNDFVYTGLGSPESDGSEQLWDREREMDEQGVAYPIDLGAGRDGLYDDTARYLIWDEQDVAAVVTHTAWFDAKQGEWNGTVRYRIRRADGTIRYECDARDAADEAYPGDTIERLYERHESEWRSEP